MNILCIDPYNFSEEDSKYPTLQALGRIDARQYVVVNPKTGKFGLTTKREDASTIEEVNAYMKNNFEKLEDDNVVLLQYVGLIERVQPHSTQTKPSNSGVSSLFSKIIKPKKNNSIPQADQNEEQRSKEIEMVIDLLGRVYHRLGK